MDEAKSRTLIDESARCSIMSDIVVIEYRTQLRME